VLNAVSDILNKLMSGDEEIAQLPRKPKTKRGKKVLDDRKPKLEEGPKQTLFLRGPKSSDDVRLLMKDLVHHASHCVVPTQEGFQRALQQEA
jgi:hypothetical protein